MNCRLGALVVATLFLITQTAHAQNVQLLPPTYPNSATPCVGGAVNNQVLFLGSNGTAGSAINCLDGTGSKFFTVDPSTGHVGIGTPSPQATLDLAGPIRPVDTTAACNAATAGSLRYNNGTNIFEGCVNVAGNWQWTQFGGNSCSSLGYPAFTASDQNGNTQCVPVCPSGLLHGSFPNPQEFRVVVGSVGTSIGEVVTTTNEDDGSPSYVVTCTWQGWSMITGP